MDYRTIFDTLSEGIFLHPLDSERIVEVNERCVELFGYTREELLGMPVSRFAADDWDPPRSAEERVREARQEGEITFEWRNQRKDGSRFWAEVTLTLVSLGSDEYVLATVRDISDRKRQERRARAVFDQTYQFTGLMDPDGTLVEANETALEFGGLERDDVIGKPIWDCYWFQHSEAVQERARQAVNRAADGEFVRHNLEVRGADGTEIIDFSIRPITDDRGEVTLLIPEGRVITELLEQQQRLDAYNRVMRHNLRNKLTVINGMTSEIRKATDDDRVAALADRVRAASDRIDDIAEQIREFDHLRQQEGQTQRVDVGELIEEVANEYATHRETTVDTNVGAATTVDTNRAMLELVVAQLVENAVEHGGSTVEITARRGPDGRVEIEVHDDGRGIPPDEIRPAVEEMEATTQVEHTTGIGLLISKWGTDELGGTLRFEGDSADGATVVVQLPGEA